MLEVGGDRFELRLQRLVLPPLAIDCGGESRQEHQQSDYDDGSGHRSSTVAPIRHSPLASDATPMASRSCGPERPFAEHTGAALYRRGLAPDRFTSERHEQPLDGIELGRVEMIQDLGEGRFLQSLSPESFAHLRRADLAPQPARDDGDHQKFTASREMGRGPHLGERSRQYRADRRTRVGFHEPGEGVGRHGVERGGLPAITISFDDQTEQGPEQPYVKLIGHALDRIRRDRGDRMGAVVEIRQCRRERDFFHLFDPQARTAESLTGSPRSCRTRARLAAPEGDSRHGPRRQIGPRQVLFHALDTRPGHSLRPQTVRATAA